MPRDESCTTSICFARDAGPGQPMSSKQPVSLDCDSIYFCCSCMKGRHPRDDTGKTASLSDVSSGHSREFVGSLATASQRTVHGLCEPQLQDFSSFNKQDDLQSRCTFGMLSKHGYQTLHSPGNGFVVIQDLWLLSVMKPCTRLLPSGKA